MDGEEEKEEEEEEGGGRRFGFQHCTKCPTRQLDSGKYI